MLHRFFGSGRKESWQFTPLCYDYDDYLANVYAATGRVGGE